MLMTRKGLYGNSEGYSDPTAGAAMSTMMKEYRQARRNEQQKLAEVKARPKVYVISQYAGDTDFNTQVAIQCCRRLIALGKIPIASHLLYPQMLDDDNPNERFLGLAFGLALMPLCDEVYVFTRGGVVSDGMQQEIDEARRLQMRIHYEEAMVGGD